jgi:hypothetical protein
MNANCGGRFRVFKRTAAGVVTELGGGPFNDGVEFAVNTPTEMLWVGNITDTAFAEDDRILVRIYITNVGTMASGHTCTLTFNAADASTGDSFFNIAETITFKADTNVFDESIALATSADVTPSAVNVITGSVSLAASATQALATVMELHPSMSLAASADQALGTQAVMDTAAPLPASAVLSAIGGLTFTEILALAARPRNRDGRTHVRRHALPAGVGRGERRRAEHVGADGSIRRTGLARHRRSRRLGSVSLASTQDSLRLDSSLQAALVLAAQAQARPPAARASPRTWRSR